MTTVHTAPEYCLEVRGPAPAGYPTQPHPDAFTDHPFAPSFEQRRQAFFHHWLNNPSPLTNKAPYYELVRLAAGGALHAGILEAAMDYIDQRKDCSDFVFHSMLRLLYQFTDHPGVDPGLLRRARETVLNFKYWPDEPGIDSMCTWTENHQILFASGAYLAGQFYPQEIFANSGETGAQKMAEHRPRILRWLDLRFRTGFSEWLSHVYYDEDMVALLSLVDFCQDEQIARRAAMLADLLLADMAINSFRGVFGSTHGRSYENTKKWASQEGTTDTQKLLFGMGVFSGYDNMSAACLVLSPRYRMPQVIYAIANDRQRPVMINRQRMGLRLDEAGRWGLGFEDFEDGMVLLSLEAYAHPRTIDLVMRMFDRFNWWQNSFFTPFQSQRKLLWFARHFRLLPLIARLFKKDVTRNTREQVDIYTYRTPDYLLSSAQDYRPGYGGDQQHIWQATLGAEAVCFTTHPAKQQGPSPNYWAGSGTLPRVAQVENVLFAVYQIDSRPGLYHTNHLFFTHAWLPRDRFDEIREENGWVFARHANGYLALRSQHPYTWQTAPGEDCQRELLAPGKENIWICEMGRWEVDGDFDQFVQRICAAEIRFSRSSVRYHSPSQGRLSFGWKGPLLKAGHEVRLGGEARYENPYARAGFPPEEITFGQGGHFLRLAWKTAERQADAFI